MRAILLAAVVLAAAFAGCTGKEKKSDDALVPLGEGPAEFQGARVTISGRVTFDFNPVAGAKVTAEPQGGETETDPDGAFSLSVLPGRYLLRVEAPGFDDASRVVEAYNDTYVDIVGLRRSLSTEPYVDTIPFAGFMECSVSVPGLAGYGSGESTSANCVALELPDALQPPSNDRHTFLFEASNNLSGLLVELSWDAGANPAAARFLVLLEQAGSGGEGGLVHERVAGASPLRLEMTPDEILTAGLAAGGALQVRVFVDASTAPGVALQQSFQVAASLFYFAPHDDGFTAFP